MKVAKIKKNNSKIDSTKQYEGYSIKQMLIIILILITVFIAFYFITILVLNSSSNKHNNNENTVIDSSKIILSQILDRKESEYYVLATMSSKYKSNTLDSVNYIQIYNQYINDYKQKSNALSFYIVDLDDAFNKNYLSDELNINNNLNEIKINDEILLKINNAKIESYYVGNTEIIKELSELKK